ncbi:MAG: tetratricopeptide repeat protein [Opitutaceae bacterium]
MNPRESQVRRLLADGLEFHRAGRLKDALARYDRVLAREPGNFDALHLAGTVALQEARWADATALLEKARRLAPANAVCAMRLGVSHAEAGRQAEAEAALTAAAALDPAMPEIWFHLGCVRWKQGRMDEAEAAYQQAISLRPSYAEALDRLGALLTARRGHAAAQPWFRRAVDAEPRLASAWCNLGVCQLYRGELSDALGCFQRALNLDPRLEHAHTARGVTLERCYDIAGARAAYEAALAVNPRNHEARSARLVNLQYLGAPRETLAAEHRRFGQAVEGDPLAAAARRFPNAPDPGRRLRIGFLSPDLHRHSVAYFLEPLLEHLDRSRFETCLYHDSAKTDDMSERLRGRCGVWRSVAGMPADALEAAVRGDGIDVLVDLAGHTGFNRLPLFARRLAPVQATYLGYPDTTGLAAMDYRLVDAVTDPVGDADRLSTERLCRFAPTAWAYAPPSGAAQPETRRHGPGGVVFGCFNNFAKVSEPTLALWSRLLQVVPAGTLALKGAGLTAPVLAAAIRRRLASAGIDPARVNLLERTKTLEEHLAAYGEVDVALDTYPYHGTTTTCEALWMGVPVVTLRGDRHASRVGASLLTAIGRPEWVATSVDGYLRIASRLAADVEAVRQGRAALRQSMAASPLLDHAGQSTRFGSALLEMWRAWCARSDAIAA